MFRAYFTGLLILFLLPASAWGQAPTVPEFTLDEVSDIFPSREFEHEIAFWRSVFSEYSTNEVIFHDPRDLRLVYYKETFERGIDDNPKEARRQREHLKRTAKKVQSLFDDIIRHGEDSGKLRAEHRKIIEVLRSAGYSRSDRELRRLRDNLRYQRGVRDKFEKSMIRSGRYVGKIEEVFRSYGLPVELAALPHVESSFDYNAYSKAGAAGIWQFTRGTGRAYLTINQQIDERLDPIRATEAAARLFRDNYQELQYWPITVTSYNHGKNGMRRAKGKFGDDLRKIVDEYESKYFGFASRNFYAEFLAALEVSRNYQRYFGDLQIESSLQYEMILLERAYDSSYFMTIPGLPREVVSEYNPHLKRVFAAHSRLVPAGTYVRVPPTALDSVKQTLASAGPSKAKLVIAEDGSMRYRIQPGDALGTIASQFGTSVAQLQRLNGISNPNRIHPGQLLLITQGSRDPGTAESSAVKAPAQPEAEASAAQKDTDRPTTYTVRKGDSLVGIAQKFASTVHAIQSANGISNPNRILPGMTLLIPGGVQSAPKKHVVRPGETLEKIARLYGSSIQKIQNANGILNPHQIRRGQELLIP